MSKLINAYRDALKSDKDKSLSEESNVFYGHKTGFDILDFRNGKKVRPADEDPYNSLGINEGSYTMFVGRSGSGKTTLALQIAINIVKKYEDAFIIHDDLEQATDAARVMQLSGWNAQQLKSKWLHKTSGITSESLYKRIKKHADQKIEMADEIKITTDKVDLDGNPIEILPPTVYILDSLALLVPEKLTEEEELSGQMSTTATAKANAQIFRRIAPCLKKANIILFVINHLTTKVDINPMAKTKAQVNYLKQDEEIPGGKTPVYLADFLIKVDAGSKMSEEEGFGVQGFMNKVTIIKSRNNRAGQEFELVFDQHRGFDNILSNFNLLKSLKRVGGAGRSFYLDSCPDIKFSQKEFKLKLRKEEDLRTAYILTMKEVLEQFIFDSDHDEKDFSDLTEELELDNVVVEEEQEEEEEEVKIPVKKKKKKPLK